MRSALVLAVLVATGCVVPRSLGTGLTAAPLKGGTHEVAVSGGFTWQTQTNAPEVTAAGNNTVTSYQTSSGLTFPAAEANVAFGLTRTFNLNFHASPAGVQPGLKIALYDRQVVLSLFPELGIGWNTGASGTTVFNGTARTDGPPSYQSNFILLAGARFLVFHPGSGAYGGVGYQFESFTQSVTTGQSGQEQKTSTTFTLHNVLASVGYEFKSGTLRIRPELAFSITPELGTSTAAGTEPAVSRSGGNAFILFPNVTFAIVGEGSKESAEDEESSEQRGSDEEDAPRKKVKAPPAEEEETPTPRRKVTPLKDDEEQKGDSESTDSN
ncbi:MAG: hypothetical protein ACJ790_18370 [Myxococcaceae bacterium]